MPTKIICLVLISVILMHENFVHATGDANDSFMEVARKCAIHKSNAVHRLCLIMGHGALNDKGEWDKKKLEIFMRASIIGEPPEAMIAEYLKCVDEGTGETVADKCNNFFKCLDGKGDVDRKLV